MATIVAAAAAAPLLPSGSAQVMAGSAKVDLQIPVGVPLAGYNHGQRRVPHWPIPKSESIH